MLDRAHALFGAPPASGASAASGAAARLSGAGELVGSGRHTITAAMSGEFATSYGAFAGRAGPALDTLAGADRRLGAGLGEAASADRSGRTTSGAVVSGAAADTAALAPHTGTPAGQKALLSALRSRVAHQQQVVAVYKARDARMAALLRSMTYRAGGGGGIPFGGGGGGGMPFSGGMQSLPGLGALPAATRGAGRTPRTTAASGPRTASVPMTPGAATFRAAIAKALDLKGITDPRARAVWEAGMMTVVSRESGFDPNAQNNSDSNARKGTPSQGGFQFIAPTFAAYHEPGTSTNVRDPVAQAAAFINYAQGRYGVALDGSDLAARIQQADPSRPPKGY